MTTISNLTGTANAAQPAIAHAGKLVKNTQSQKGFWRRIKHSKKVLSFESSAGGLVQIPIAELWKLGEAHDGNLKTPQMPNKPPV